MNTDRKLKELSAFICGQILSFRWLEAYFALVARMLLAR
jgi:hypothetical protein